MTTTFTVSTINDLANDIATIDSDSAADQGAGVQFAIQFAQGVVLTETSELDAINLQGKDTLTLDGNGGALSGGDTYRGLFVYSGAVVIENLTIENAVAIGGAGAGGGAGLGGGLFVADDTADGASTAGDVTLANVNFLNDSAVGGAASSAVGGGGLGGSADDVGGGGVGLGATGAASGAGSVGIIPGAAAGGSAFGTDFYYYNEDYLGGASGGGGAAASYQLARIMHFGLAGVA